MEALVPADNWVNYDGVNLYMAPGTGISPGPYVFELVARIDGYSNITVAMPFEAVVLPCQTGLDITGLSLEDQSRIWYQDTLPYPIGGVLSQVVESPVQCGYGITFQPRLRTGPTTYTNLPREVQWDPSTATFFIEKCFSDPDDPDCKGLEPFTINRDIVVFAILDDGTNQVVEQLEFRGNSDRTLASSTQSASPTTLD